MHVRTSNWWCSHALHAKFWWRVKKQQSSVEEEMLPSSSPCAMKYNEDPSKFTNALESTWLGFDQALFPGTHFAKLSWLNYVAWLNQMICFPSTRIKWHISQGKINTHFYYILKEIKTEHLFSSKDINQIWYENINLEFVYSVPWHSPES